MSIETHRAATPDAAPADAPAGPPVGADPLAIVETDRPVHPAVQGDVDEVMVRIGRAVKANGRQVGELSDRLAGAERDLRTFLTGLLDVMDAFDRVRQEAEGSIAGVPRSVEATAKLLERRLAKQGVQRVELVGRELDPELADADEVVVDPSVAEETVVRVVVSAYSWRGEVLRRGVVVVSTRGGR